MMNVILSAFAAFALFIAAFQYHEGLSLEDKVRGLSDRLYECQSTDHCAQAAELRVELERSERHSRWLLTCWKDDLHNITIDRDMLKGQFDSLFLAHQQALREIDALKAKLEEGHQ